MDCNSSVGITNNDKYIFWICVVDIFFLPYFYFVTISYSLPFICLWFLFSKNKPLKKGRTIFLLIFFLTLGTALGAIINSEYAYKNIVYFVQYLQFFLYYLLFVYYMQRKKVKVERILFFFSLFVLISVLAFIVYFPVYVGIRFVFAHQFYQPSEDIYSGYRFGFIWGDENNITYIITAVLLYYHWLPDKKKYAEILIFVTTVLTLITSASTGGIIAFALSTLIVVVSSLNKKKQIKISVLLWVLVILLIFVIWVFVDKRLLEKITSIDLIASVKYRFAEKTAAGGDPRKEIWLSFLKNKPLYQYLFFGNGAITVYNGAMRSTHCGVLYLIYGFGLIFCVVFIKEFLMPKKTIALKKQVYLVPVFIGFFINIMFEEIKLAGIVAFLVAASESCFCQQVETMDNQNAKSENEGRNAQKRDVF